MTKKTTHLSVDILAPEYGPGTEFLNRFLIPDNFCPSNTIDHFWSKYTLAEAGTLLFAAEVICEARKQERDPINLSAFLQDLSELLTSVYLEHRYNPHERKLIIVEPSKSVK